MSCCGRVPERANVMRTGGPTTVGRFALKLRPRFILSAMAGDTLALMSLMRDIAVGDVAAVGRALVRSPALGVGVPPPGCDETVRAKVLRRRDRSLPLRRRHPASRRGSSVSTRDRARAGVNGRGRTDEKPSRSSTAALRRGRCRVQPLGPKRTEGHRCRVTRGWR